MNKTHEVVEFQHIKRRIIRLKYHMLVPLV